MKLPSHLSCISMVLFLFTAHAVAGTCGITGQDEVCEGQEVWYELESDIPGNNINWFVTGGIVIQQNNSQRKALIRFTTAGQGLIQVLHIKLYPEFVWVACSLPVTIATGPAPAIEVDNSLCPLSMQEGEAPEFRTCESNTSRLTATGLAGSMFRWYADQPWVHFSPDDMDVTQMTFSGIGLAEVCVEELTTGGCTGTTCIRVEVQSYVSAWFGIEHYPDTPDIRICKGERLYFQATGFDPNSHYRWTVLDTDSAVMYQHTQQGLQGGAAWNHMFGYEPGEYLVCLQLAQNMSCPCTSSPYCRTIRVEGGCRPPVICPSVVCAGETVEYCVDAALACTGFNWTVEGGTIITYPPSSRCIQVHWDDPGPAGSGVLWLNVDTCLACEQVCAGPYMITVPVLSPEIEIQGPEDECVAEPGYNEFLWHVPFIPGAIYSWDTVVISGTVYFQNPAGSPGPNFYRKPIHLLGNAIILVR
jgi:hypothetical protein